LFWSNALWYFELVTHDVNKMLNPKIGISPLELIRKKEQIFRDNFKGKELSDDEWIQVMVDNPKLIERPIAITEDKAVIGRPKENVLELLG